MRGRTRNALWRLAALALMLSGTAACRRFDYRTVTIRVPGMQDAAAASLVRNALEVELARNDQQFTVDLKKNTVTFTAGRSLGVPETVAGIETELSDVGMTGKVSQVRHVPFCRACGPQWPLAGPRGGVYQCVNPQPSPNCPRTYPEDEVNAADDRGEFWAARRVATISAPQMNSRRSANIVVAAIAHAVRRESNPAVKIDLAAHTATVRYDSLVTSEKNLEQAVACAGFDADDVPANLNGADALRWGW